ncbi:ATPase family associated with various cellular activities (AAA) [Amycolatopsis pretoriensis]|uniref:ATPase family associated with various cellular activities (AAA) n=1 Tax=Amycolatopsis pretoriensis TaxID=218821 RepID=A0A1H5Q1R0_9PSEU|nr:ATP-binding protein [Amycolatopsis pretoriensis]SEF19844.1 ATPase family associated with various cellular activities (AAA) [Amycolatopsis pretoriensis]
MSGLAVEHLRARMAELHRALRIAVAAQSEAAAALTRPDLTPFCVTDDQVDALLDRVDAFTEAMTEPPSPVRADPESEQQLRRLAAARGVTLPLDALATRYGLSRAEQDALLLVAAPELDPGYERVYAYVVDNLNRRAPCVELLVTVLGETPADRLALRRALGAAGRLRRYGLLRAYGEAPAEPARELALGDGVFEYLMGWGGDVGTLGDDPGEVAPAAAAPHLESARLTKLGQALHSGDIDVVGLWGLPADSQADAAQALAAAAGRPLRRVGTDVARDLRTAAALEAILWIPTDGRAAHPDEPLLRSGVPLCLTGVTPWRPPRLLAARTYAELTIPVPGFPERRAMWSSAFPVLDPEVLTDLAARYRMSGGELRAVAAVADADARLSGNGHPITEHVEPAIATVTRGRTSGAVQSIIPRRGLADLVLPEAQMSQIAEIASAFRAWPRIAESWGFARKSATGGVKALFTGEPGTGKTMSAEVVTGILGLELLKVDLAQVVSKWVGETEKNMEAVFRQAEDSHAVVLFDEADALFGKRGEVKQGTDRYANLEVGYLLQRLEASDGLIILTSNLKENIDPAFTRRFHFVVHFPRPSLAERRRLWQLAFPPEAPLSPDVDVDVLCRLDMTGAGIASAARTAALAAADAGAGSIGMRHVVRGVSRQFQREARLFRPAELGRYAGLLADNGSA